MFVLQYQFNNSNITLTILSIMLRGLIVYHICQYQVHFMM